MPSKRIIVTAIICLGIILSIYLVTQKSLNLPLIKTNSDNILSSPLINIETKGNDWQKILTKVQPNDTISLIAKNDGVADETSLTAQMSRDFFSRYLLIANKEGGITEEDALKISDETLTNSEYTKITTTIFSEKNLTIVKSTTDNKKNYATAMREILRIRSSEVRDNPLNIIDKATKTESEAEIAKLDPIILSANNFLNDLVKISVPQDAVSYHLSLLNAVSAMKTNLEAIRYSSKDPVRGLNGLSNYMSALDDFQAAIKYITAYLNN